MFMFMSHHQNSGHNPNLKTAIKCMKCGAFLTSWATCAFSGTLLYGVRDVAYVDVKYKLLVNTNVYLVKSFLVNGNTQILDTLLIQNNHYMRIVYFNEIPAEDGALSPVLTNARARESVSKSFWTESITKSITITNTRWEATQRVMAAKLTRLTHRIAT
jgi:hypothetical protein